MDGKETSMKAWNKMERVPSTAPIASECIITFVCCNCSTDTELPCKSNRCSCRQYGITCLSECGKYHAPWSRLHEFVLQLWDILWIIMTINQNLIMAYFQMLPNFEAYSYRFTVILCFRIVFFRMYRKELVLMPCLNFIVNIGCDGYFWDTGIGKCQLNVSVRLVLDKQLYYFKHVEISDL